MLYNTRLFFTVYVWGLIWNHLWLHAIASTRSRCHTMSNCQDFTANRTCSVCKLFYSPQEADVSDSEAQWSPENQTMQSGSQNEDRHSSVNGYYCIRRCRVARWRRDGYHHTASATADYTISRPASYSGQWTLQFAVGVNAVTDVTAHVWTEIRTELNWWLCFCFYCDVPQACSRYWDLVLSTVS